MNIDSRCVDAAKHVNGTRKRNNFESDGHRRSALMKDGRGDERVKSRTKFKRAGEYSEMMTGPARSYRRCKDNKGVVYIRYAR
jgi:hypothetical protein